jgi:hypothetical protein|tara:strand:- start:464 stop:613 length:150 start_codon:yes stop_codon:yes gene_type:complete
MSLPWQIMAQYEAIYEKHLEKMLAKYKDVDKAELEAMFLFEEEVEQMEG